MRNLKEFDLAEFANLLLSAKIRNGAFGTELNRAIQILIDHKFNLIIIIIIIIIIMFRNPHRH